MEFAPLTLETEHPGHMTTRERILTVKVWRALERWRRVGVPSLANVGKRVGELIGRSESAVRSVMNLAHSSGGELELKPPNRKRPRAAYDHDEMRTALRSFVVNELEAGRVVTRRSAGEMINERFGLEYTVQNVGLTLKKFDYDFKLLRKQSDKHDEESYVKLRDTYVRLLTRNRRASTGPRAGLPVMPEV